MDKYERRRQRLLFLKKQFCQNKISILADRLDRPHSYVSRMLYPEGKAHKRRIGDDMLEHIAQTFDVSKAWVDGLVEDTLAATMRLKFYGASDEGGAEPMWTPWLKSIEVLPEEVYLQAGLASSDNICLMTPLDDCMSPTIPRQSIVLMDASIANFIGNGVYCVRFGTVMTFRRMQQAQYGVIRVTSDNHVYSEGAFDYDLAASASWQICGKLLQVLPLVFSDL